MSKSDDMIDVDFGFLASELAQLASKIAAAQAARTRLITAGPGRRTGMDKPGEPVEEFWTHEPVTGWRIWTLGGRGNTCLIGSAGHMWRKPTFSASHSSAFHSSPQWGCLCGINAAKSLELLEDNFGRQLPGQVYGRVALTGSVHEYELGYRAERAEIVDLTMYVSVGKGYWFTEKDGQRRFYSPSDIVLEAKNRAEIMEAHYRIPVEMRRVS
jgi:hypothetical protein